MNSHGGKSGHSDHHHYLLTEDLGVLMRNWATHTGFVVPETRWFAQNHLLLRHALEHALQDKPEITLVDSLPHHHMAGEIQRLVYQLHSNQELNIDLGCVISLDQVYTLDTTYNPEKLHVNRVTDPQSGAIEHQQRLGFPSIDEQIVELRRSLDSLYVIVVDDGIYTGDTMQWVLRKLRQHNIDVKAIVVGVQVKHPGQVVDYGINGNYIRTVETYSSSRPVLDWVCERDFFVGTPLGGRTLKGKEGYSKDGKTIATGAFYPVRQQWLADWASISDPDGEFGRFCLDRSDALFSEIEKLSGRPVLLGDLERLPVEVLDDEPDLGIPVRAYLNQLREVGHLLFTST